MAVLQFKAVLLIIGIAAGRKLLFRFFPPHVLEWLWILIGIRLLLPQGIGIPVMSIRQPWLWYPCDPAASLSDGAVRIRQAGTGVILLILLSGYIRFYGRMKQKEALQNDVVCCWAKAHFRSSHYHIYTSSAVTSPIVYGLLSPKIVLPVQQYSAVQYEHILLHEWMHIRRRDLWKKAFMLAAAVLNWYNPACWLMMLLFNRDIELACDADVLRTLGKEGHTGYAHVLLDCYCPMNPSAVSETGFLSGMLQERIGAIMNQKKISKKTKCCAVFLFGILFLTIFGKASVQADVTEGIPVLAGKTAPEAEALLQQEGYDYVWKTEDARQ